MPKQFHCSECGSELVHTRMAIPKQALILDLIEPHECGPKVDLVNEFSRDLNEFVEYVEGDKKKSVQKSNDLFTEPGDRRDATTPVGVLGMLDSFKLKG